MLLLLHKKQLFINPKSCTEQTKVSADNNNLKFQHKT
jgi:hypothetical protein